MGISAGRERCSPHPTSPPQGWPEKSPAVGEESFRIARCRGFSLIELLVVLVLIGIMAGVAAPPMGRFLDSLEFKKQTGKIMAAIRYARLKAITEGKVVVMTAVEGDATQGLTLSGAVNEVRQLDLAEGATLEIEPLELIFSPEGYATPGTLILTSGERSQTIFIDSMTALPLIEDVDEK
ncbi:MAG: GspH/FimT family protein [Desulfobulbaceae bacterium]|nr:GspH/FimT family protein [Desulfobulbaceae bacterium]